MAPNTSAHTFNLRASGGQFPGTVLVAEVRTTNNRRLRESKMAADDFEAISQRIQFMNIKDSVNASVSDENCEVEWGYL